MPGQADYRPPAKGTTTPVISVGKETTLRAPATTRDFYSAINVFFTVIRANTVLTDSINLAESNVNTDSSIYDIY